MRLAILIIFTINSLALADSKVENQHTEKTESTFRFECVVKFGRSMGEEEAKRKCSELLASLTKKNNGIVPFYASSTRQNPKIRAGMTKSEVLATFGRPSEVDDDGKTLRYENQKFCKKYALCYVSFGGPLDPLSQTSTGWSGFKFEFTNNLEDRPFN